MVVMPVAAKPVARLSTVVHQRVDDAALGEARERPIDRGEADALPGVDEQRVDLLCGRVVT